MAITITMIDSIPDFNESHVYLSDGRVLIHLDSPEHHDDRVEGCVEVGCRLATTTVLDDNTVNGEELTVYHFVKDDENNPKASAPVPDKQGQP